MNATSEKTYKPISGYVMLLVVFLMVGGAIFGVAVEVIPVFAVLLLLAIFFSAGFFVVNPNSSRVLVLFGDYRGTVKDNGFFWVNPFFNGKSVSLRARNFDSEKVKVNDKLGNPIMIGAILVWQVKDSYKASFEVDNYENFVKIQSEAAIRNLAGAYPYDNFEDAQTEVTLRSGLKEVNHALEEELRERLEIAGIAVIEARISYLAYAPEIANAMLRRQQATAIVSARQKIVEGAVGMVEMALMELSKKEIIHLDEERKAAMVSNLMVVLCSDKDATPIVNTGSLY
jgi:regulator of protease activity HflC (stomatin/prohibitin superfamily)